jgi:hypothetical protein
VKTVFHVALVFSSHVAFLFGAYGTRLLSLIPFYNLAIFVWLGLSTLIAAYAYFLVFDKLTQSYASVLYTVVATCTSFYLGVFLAFNTFGT